MKAPPPIAEAFVLLAELAVKRGVAPINRLEGCWEFELGTRPDIRVAVNGHKFDQKTSLGTAVRPFNAYMTWNGWPFAILTPVGGQLLQSPARKPGSAERLVVMRLGKLVRSADE